MSGVSTALQNIRKDDGTDTQCVLHLVQLLKSSDQKHIPELLTLSPNCSEVFDWWDKGPGLHTQSAACFTLFGLIYRGVLKTAAQFQAQAVAISRKLLKERLHSVYGCLSKYSSIPARKHCLEFLLLLNCLGGSVTKVLLDDFNFANTSLKDMLRNQGAAHEDAVRFMLSFLCVPAVDLKVKFMGIKNVLKMMTGLINKDSVELKLEFISVLVEHVLKNTKIQKKTKCQFFSVPVLLKISHFLSEENVDLQLQTGVFFESLFHCKTGVLFESSAGDVFSDSSSNPILLSFIRHSGLDNKLLTDFFLQMVHDCPEVSSALVTSFTAAKKPTDTPLPQLLQNLCKVLQGRDISRVLSLVTADITDKQLVQYLVPKCVTDLLEKQLKCPELDPALYPLILLLVEAAGAAVQTLTDRTLLQDVAIFYLVDISTVRNAGLLTPKLACTFVNVDRYCLVQYKISSLIESKACLTGDEIGLLNVTFPKYLLEFVTSNCELVCSTILSCETGQVLLEKILTAARVPEKQVKVVRSTLFDDHDGVQIYQANIGEEIAAERGTFVRRIINPKIAEITDIVTYVSENNTGSQFIPKLLKFLLAPVGQYKKEEDMVIENLEEFMKAPKRPIFLLGAYFFQQWFLMPWTKHQYLGEKYSVALLETHCRAIEIALSYFVEVSSIEPASLNLLFRTIFEDSLFRQIEAEPTSYERVVSTFLKIVDILLGSDYKFSCSEILHCINIRTIVTDRRIVDMIRHIQEPDEHESIRAYLPIVRNHLPQIQTFARAHSFVFNNEFLSSFFDLFRDCSTDMNTAQISSFALNVLEFLSGENKTSCLELFNYMSKNVLINLFSELIKEDSHYIKDGFLQTRLCCVVALQAFLKQDSPTHEFLLSVEQYQKYADSIADCAKDDVLMDLICQIKAGSREEALFAVAEAVKHRVARFFVLESFDAIAELSLCMKNKKLLKQIFEMMAKSMDVENFAIFLSQYVTVYEDNLPIFTRKQVQSSMERALESLAPDNFSGVKMFVHLLVAFQDMLSPELTQSVFLKFIGQTTVREILVSQEATECKNTLTKLFLSLLHSSKVSEDAITRKFYMFFQTSYSATTSEADENLLQILKYFDEKGVKSKYPFAYGSYVNDLKHIKNITLYNEHCIKILDNFEPILLNNLLDNFPLHSVASSKQAVVSVCTVSYSAEFIISLLYHVLYHGEVEVRMLLSHPITRVALLALSSYDEVTRHVGYACVDKLTLMIEEEKFKEKSMCLYLFKLLENSVTCAGERLPHLSVYFLGKMLHTLWSPQRNIYTSVCYFLLQRPTFDFQDVPLFYGLFCSAAQHYKQDQNWLLEVLCVAVRDEVDYRILARRHVLPLCSSQLYCPGTDKHTGRLIKKLFAKVGAIKSTKVQKDLEELAICVGSFEAVQ